jgi:hypothetical protein
MVNKISFILIGVIILFSCTGRQPTMPEAFTSVAPHILWRTAGAEALPGGVDSIRLTISSQSLDKDRVKTFSYTAHEGLFDNLPVGITIKIKVEGLDAAGNVLFHGEVDVRSLGSQSQPPVIIEIEANQVTPLPPSELSVRRLSGTSFIIDWKDNSYNEQAFVIQRKTGPDGAWETVTTVETATTFIDDGLTPYQTYYYRVYAKNAAGHSSLSAVQFNTASPDTGNNRPVMMTNAYDLPVSLKVDYTFNSKLHALDAEGDTIRFLVADPPLGFTVNETTGAFSWIPVYPGDYIIIFKAVDHSSGYDSLLWEVTVIDHTPYIGFNPPSLVRRGSEKISVDLVVKNMTNLFGLSCEIIYPKEFLKLTQDSIREGTFFGDSSISIFAVDLDTISIGFTRKQGSGSVSGDGVVATINFEAAWSGLDTLKILDQNFELIDKSGELVYYFTEVKKGEGFIRINP